MTEYTEKPLSEIKVGSIIVKNNGFVYQVSDIHEISKNVRCVIFEDSYGNFITEYCNINKEFYVREDHLHEEKEAPMGKIQRTPGERKKFKVRVKGPNGNPVTVRFGDPGLSIKRHRAGRRKNFRARHNCDNPGPRWKARYWACRTWQKSTSVSDLTDDFDVSAWHPRNIFGGKKDKKNEKNENPTAEQLRRIASGQHFGTEVSPSEMSAALNANKLLGRLHQSYEPEGEMIESHSKKEAKLIKSVARMLRAHADELDSIDESVEDVIKKLAKRHNVSESDIEEQLEMGMEVEKEHTSDPKEAMKIAVDHIEEKPNYYTLLKKYVEKDMKENLEESKLYKRLVSQLKAKGMSDDKAYAIATAQMKKSGLMPKKGGPKDLTRKGKKRQAMGAAGRAKDRAAKRSGRKPSAYKYNPRTNGATLKEASGEILSEGENKPTNPSAWADCLRQAKSKFKVYPSAYANGWAAKCYKKKGGGWKKAK